MKEVVKVSISGIAFTFDYEAYLTVKRYLDRLQAAYAAKPDGREIVADIEARMAELILDGQENDRTAVSTDLANAVVEQLGFPDDMDESPEPCVEKIPKRLYRNPDGAVLGGVCSGLGAYFHIDPVWIRLGFFLPLLLVIISAIFPGGSYAANFFGSLFGMFLMLYIVLWIAIPLARTPRQRLEMKGEKVTASSIHQTFSEDASAMSSSPRRQRSASVLADIVYGIGRILMFIIKAVVFIVALGVGIAVIATLAALTVAIFHEELTGGKIIVESFSGLDGITAGAYLALVIVAALIPLVVLGYFLLKILFGSKTNKTFVLICSVVWIILIVYLSVVTAHNADNLREGVYRLGDEIEAWEDERGLRTGSRWERRYDAYEYWEDDELEEYYREYAGEDEGMDNVKVEITEKDGAVVIDRVVLDGANPSDTLRRERIVVDKKSID